MFGLIKLNFLSNRLRGLFVFLLLLVWGPTAVCAATTEDSTDALLLSLTDQKKVECEGLGFLANREMERPLSNQELNTLNRIVASGTPMYAGNAARVLARCRQNSVSQRLPVVIQRYILDINKPKGKVEAQTYIICLSQRVNGFYYFLSAFDQFKDPAVAEALKLELKKPQRAESRKWLQIALGYIGQGVDRAALMQMARSDADNSLRICAIHAYARTANLEAFPFLTVMAYDQTITGYTCTRPIQGFREAALEEVDRLKKRKL